MNIKQAKEYIKSSVHIYLKKDEFGEYRVPVVIQRPIFLYGPPGIGKTAIMRQIAGELGIALVTYSMTHHTRQSALGLPFITRKNYGGNEYDVSEYTMSEIIASVYETMEASGMKEGILFLDEINCVSETLAPSMLQFLQCKIFGKHHVPEGWVIVTAGNPPEYNKSVREFDVATMDRLKILDVEDDYAVWRVYAIERGIHNSIINYLDLNKEHFYLMETTIDGRSYITARGWEDLSEIFYLYEEEKLLVDENLVGQYLHNEKVVKEFCAYYDLYQKYKSDYKIEEILTGHITEEALNSVKDAAFDERLSLLGMLLDKVQGEIKENIESSDYLSDTMRMMKALQKMAEGKDGKELISLLEKQEDGRRKVLESLQKANSLSGVDKKKHKRVIAFLKESRKALMENPSFEVIRSRFNAEAMGVKSSNINIQKRMHHMFAFVEQAFAGGNEMLVLVTELTVNSYSSRFISTFGSEDYKKYNQELMITERHFELQKEIEELEL